MAEEYNLARLEREGEVPEVLMNLMRTAVDSRASDIHVAAGCPVMYRVDGDLLPMTKENTTPEEVEAMIKPMLTTEQQKELVEKGELDFAYSIAGFSRVRVNAFRQRGTYSIAFRILSSSIPEPEQLGLPDAVAKLANLQRGLVLVTGATGSGKSTTLAALIGSIAKTYPKNIITLEDPVEYVHKHSKSMVLQREVGSDTLSYANALRAALRQDPDVILVGEMRDLETISTALTAAETGHLVFSTLHTNSAADSIDRVIDVFPPHQQQQIRVQLAGVIQGVIAQHLLPLQTAGGGRVAAFEVMLQSPAISNLIREGKAYQIPSMIQTSRKDGMQLMDDSIYDLFMKRRVSAETAIAYAHDQDGMRRKVQMF